MKVIELFCNWILVMVLAVNLWIRILVNIKNLNVWVKTITCMQTVNRYWSLSLVICVFRIRESILIKTSSFYLFQHSTGKSIFIVNVAGSIKLCLPCQASLSCIQGFIARCCLPWPSILVCKQWHHSDPFCCCTF